VSKHPEQFGEFLATLSSANAGTQGWPDEQLAGYHRARAHCARRP
jgi:hypothetical protein